MFHPAYGAGPVGAWALLGLRTGDADVVDADGFLFVRDRVKDMAISGGENVYPAEVERVLHAHPAVADVAVFGVPDPKWGEVLRAAVVLHPGRTASAEELVAHCVAHLARYKCPREIDFPDALPRNATGKVLKRTLREPFWVGHTRGI